MFAYSWEWRLLEVLVLNKFSSVIQKFKTKKLEYYVRKLEALNLKIKKTYSTLSLRYCVFKSSSNRKSI